MPNRSSLWLRTDLTLRLFAALDAGCHMEAARLAETLRRFGC